MLGIQLAADAYLKRLQEEVDRVDRAALERWADLIYEAWDRQQTVFILGNGGSGTTASHMSEDLGKSTLPESELYDEDRKRLKVMSLTDNVGWIMAVANDLSYDQIFQQQLMNFAQPRDVVVAISGSGNSPNVLNAVDWANRQGLRTFGLTGYDGGQLRERAGDGLHVALDDMGMVESIHLCLFHWVLNDVHARINRSGRYAA
jgi:D-sedoheptulose 7-phosphate isomerase